MKNVKSTFSHAFSHKNGLTLIEGGLGFRTFALITVTFTCSFFLIINRRAGDRGCFLYLCKIQRDKEGCGSTIKTLHGESSFDFMGET